MGVASCGVQVRSDLAAKAVMNSGFPGSLDFDIEDKRSWSAIITVKNKYQVLNPCHEPGVVVCPTPIASLQPPLTGRGS